MTAIRTPDLTHYIANQIIESVSEPASTVLYISVGRIGSWANDEIADTPVNTTDEINGVWNHMHFAKKISGNDISVVVRRIDWTANTVYDAYAHNVDLTGLDYYVLTSDFNVYKCLDNNRGSPSTIKPTYTGAGTTNRTADGYLWKYMFTVSRSQRLKFLTADWLPVSELTRDDGSVQFDVQDSAVDGSIESIRVIDIGNGFTNLISTTVTIGGDGSGATASLVANTSTDTVQYIVVTSKGSGYTWANVTLTPSSSSANGATVEAIISPYGGHGSNPIAELGATGLMIDVRLKGDEDGLIKVDNEFRQVALIRDPILRLTGNVSANTICSQVTKIDLSGSSNQFIIDEWAYQGASLASATFKGKVIWAGANEIHLSNTSGTIRSSSIFGANSAAARFLADYTNTDLIPRTGKILYIRHRTPITRATDQTESLQVPIIF